MAGESTSPESSMVADGSPSELVRLLNEAKDAATQAAQVLESVRSRMLPEGSRITGRDEDRDVEVVIDPGTRILELRIDDAVFSRDDDDDDGDEADDDAEGGVAKRLSVALMTAYKDAVKAVYDPDLHDQVEEPAEPVTAPARTFPTLAYVEPGQWPSRARHDEWERLQQRADEIVATRRTQERQESVEGHDPDRRVTVTTNSAGLLRTITFNERWLDGVGGSVVAATVLEALHHAYAEIDAAVQRQEV